ncbi:MAG: M1 family metallopeptidase, partial [Lewinella sp.]|uniref:M1 family metallopeptidase n=1 Tax=Lewinella sp. TaxID=2004506 RepID=UPI003D6B4281
MTNFIIKCGLLIIIAMITGCNQPPAEIVIEEGVSLALAKQRKGNISELTYDLHFQIPENKTASIPAKVVASFELQSIENDLQLDFKALIDQIGEVQVNGEVTQSKFQEGHLILPRTSLAVGENRVEIDFIAGDLSLNRKGDFLYTLLVPDRASTLFPCFDQPDLKAKFTLSLDVAAEWEALGNGAILETKLENDRKLISFKETAPISTYLFAFTAGRFQVEEVTIGGRPMRMLYRESDSEKVQRNLPEIFSLHQQALEWMERYTAIPLPFEKFDFALIPGFQYGGMEHVGAIFYRESSLMLDENATQNQQIGRASLIAHETAHMWFGDLVTMEWFSDVWLKEVFANFMAAKIVNPGFPTVNHDLNFLLRHQPSAYGEDRSGGSHPIQQPLDNLREAGTLYGRIIYQKAPVVMRQLEDQMGVVGLRDGLRVYLRRFAYGNASWDDLINILDERTEEDLKSWSEIWVKSAGMPVFTIEDIEKDGEQTLNITKEG